MNMVDKVVNEIKIKGKLRNFISLYRSPNHGQNDFESFINNLEYNLNSVMVNNPFLTVILGDFNAKSSLWYNNDITTHEGSKTDGVISKFGLQQIYRLLIVYRPDFYNSTKFSYGIWSSIFTTRKLHHHITFAKFNLRIHYPHPYERERHYQKANVDQIR